VTDGGSASQAEVQSKSVFRDRWLERRSASPKLGELINEPRWIAAGLIALATLLIAGFVAGGTVTIAQTEALPAVAQGDSVTAMRFGTSTPDVGTAGHFRDASGASISVVVTEVTATEVRARLPEASAMSVGELVLPAEPKRLIDVLLPGPW
jgi:hypothetical protein